MPLFIAAKNMRGKWASAPKGAAKIDVTSAQSKKNRNRIAFSPMHVCEGRSYAAPDGEYACFEHWWQSLKVYADMDHKKGKDWWKTQMKAKRRLPHSKGKSVLHAVDPRNPTVKLDYVCSRKQVYVPDYMDKIKDEEGHEGLIRIRTLLEEQDVVIYDFDGPRAADGTPECREVTVELLREKINDTLFPFGHGYITAAAALQIPPSAYA